MTLLADFEDYRLLQHIKSSGYLDGFTDFLGSPQPALAQSSGMVDLTEHDNNTRVFMCRTTGNDQRAQGSIPETIKPASCFVFGRSGISDAGVVKGLAEDLAKWLRDDANYKSDAQCISAIQTLGVGGPFIAESNRPYFEISLIVRFTEK